MPPPSPPGVAPRIPTVWSCVCAKEVLAHCQGGSVRDDQQPCWSRRGERPARLLVATNRSHDALCYIAVRILLTIFPFSLIFPSGASETPALNPAAPSAA